MDARISNLSQIASLHRYTFDEGKEKGMSVIDCDNGKLRFIVNVDKAADISQMYFEGRNISFISKNGQVAEHLEFGRRFEGGMLYTCGLDDAGGRAGYEVHGTLHCTPSEIIHAECNDKEIVIEAIIRDTALFGKNLVLKRRITSAVGSGSVKISDTLTNNGYLSTKYCVLYHVNVGYPMLCEGARIEAELDSCEARTPYADKKMSEMLEITEPLPGQEETCYYLKLSKPEISLYNNKEKRRFVLKYSKETLPCFVEWKSMASGDYALGFEPSTTELDERFKYNILEPGQSVEFFVELSVFDV